MGLRLENLGHSTLSVKLGGLEILTDPFLTDSAGGIRRVVPPAKRPEEVLPDLILISHGHYDHLDLKTLRRLRNTPLIITPENFSPILKGFNHVELKSFETFHFKGLKITLVPARHNRGRNILYPNTGVGGFIVQWQDFTLYFAGDTAFSEHLYISIAEKFPKIDVAILPIGGFLPFFRKFHQTPEEAVKAFKLLKARYLIPIHFGSWHIIPFCLKLEKAEERLRSYAFISGIENSIVLLKTGESITLY